jgi:hypothetical protein
MKEISFTTLTGLVLEKLVVSKNRDEIEIQASGRKFIMNHDQDCCENVMVESVQGNVSHALGEKIIDATMTSNKNDEPQSPNLPQAIYTNESWTWTYYTIRTQSETIVIRWYGASNGYYSESVDFSEIV